MILILGRLQDNGIALLVHRLVDRTIPFLVLDPRGHGSGYSLAWEMDGGRIDGVLGYGRKRLPLGKVASVYVHLLQKGESDVAEGRHRPEETLALLHAFLESAPIPVCNRPSCSATNFSKTYQQQLIKSHGFDVPKTLVTNLPEEASGFFEQCRGRVIYKSLSSRRSIVRRMAGADLGRLAHLSGGPTQFQEWIPGTDVRVHVMGRRLYATEIATEAVDYRFSSRERVPRRMRGIELPVEVAGRCLTLAAALGMMAAGVDLRRGLDRRWYCLEVNPTPAFAFYEQFTGQRITDGLIDALLEAGLSTGGRTTQGVQTKGEQKDERKRRSERTSQLETGNLDPASFDQA